MAYTYNGESDFLTWYKKNNNNEDYEPNNIFTRPEGMSDEVWSAVMPLYNYYLQGRADNDKKTEELGSVTSSYNNQITNLLNNYNSNLSSLNTSKRLAQQNASISLDKLKKYLPSQIKAQGLEGLGVSETASLQAYNNYMNEMGEISANYDKNLTDLNAARDSSANELERYKMDAEREINARYAGYERERNEKAGTSALDAYNSALENNRIKQEAADKEKLENDKVLVEQYFLDENYEKVKEMIDENTEDPSLKYYLDKATAALEDQNVRKTLNSDYNVPLNGTVFDLKGVTPEDVLENIDVKYDEKDQLQETWIKTILTESANWGAEHNGIVVDFNYGKQAGTNVGNIFVFYNKKWYQTNYTKNTKPAGTLVADEEDDLKNKFSEIQGNPQKTKTFNVQLTP